MQARANSELCVCSVRLCVGPKTSLFNCVVPTIGRACNRTMRVFRKSKQNISQISNDVSWEGFTSQLIYVETSREPIKR